MLRFKFFLIFCFILSNINPSQGQIIKKPEYHIGAGSVLYSGKFIPFWLYSNQHGLILPDENNFYIQGGISAEFSTEKKIDYAYGLEFVNSYAKGTDFYLPQAYLKLKIHDLQFSVGNFYSDYGNQDKSLSSGNILWSGNARTFPRISIEVPDYTPVPYTHGFVEYKGGISHGWLGSNDSVKNLWLHHKYLFLRFGGKYAVNFHIGLHHFAQWGGKTRYGEMPKDFNAYMKIFLVQSGDKDNSLAPSEWINKLGNHIGSFNVGTDVKWGDYTAGIYWQTIFEDQSGMKFKNLADGLWGIYLRTKEKERIVNGFAYEYINTTNQSGSKFMVDNEKVEGNDDYFNNGVYFTGWSFKDFTIGTPFITSPYIMKGSGRDYFRNNKIQAHHFGVEGVYKNLYYKVFYSYVVNYGTNKFPFSGSEMNHSFALQTLFSGIMPFNADLGVSMGADLGSMYGKNAGIMVSIIKKGNF